MAYKPFLATDAVEDKIKFPVAILPKIDGVRAVNPCGQILGRSLKQFKNKHLNRVFSGAEFAGYDGELVCGLETDPDLCRNTTSSVNTIEGEPVLTWHIFDLCAESVAHLGYAQRYKMMKDFITDQHQIGNLLDLKVVPMYIVNTLEELLEWESTWLDMGYEGIIIRDLNFKYKHGRGTAREGGYLRIKRFIQEDAIVLDVLEGETNLNEATINELGKTTRSSHQENKVPNGMVGVLVCKDVKTGNEIKVSPGKLTEAEKIHFFQNQHLIKGRTISYKHFPHGVKDKPRFANFMHFRDESDQPAE
ncbi:DNA ligase [Hafnia phage yong3]|nr:DNA ligase [Hafnia phage yong3]